MAEDYSQMSDLLGVEIIEIARAFVEYENKSYCCQDTLLLKIENTNIVELVLTKQYGLKLYTISSAQETIIDPDTELELEDRIIAKDVECKHLSLPFVVKSITEFWAEQEGDRYLIGFILHDQDKYSSLLASMDTDEIEILNHTDFYERSKDFPFYCDRLIAHWYDKITSKP
jgi:hypothetical protein